MKKKIIFILLSLTVITGGLYYYFSQDKQEPVHIKQETFHKHKEEVKTEYIKYKKEKIYLKQYIPKTNKRIPVIIISHGYTSTSEDMEDICEMIYKKGIGCIIFDYIGGSTKSKSNPDMSKMTVLTEKKELEHIITYTQKLDYVDQSKLYLAGHSQGGLVSALTANDRLDIEALFLVAPAFNIPEMCQYTSLPKKGQTVKFGAGEISRQYIEDGRKINLYEDINHYKNPVYIFHGSIDQTVFCNESIDASESYKNCELTIYNGQGHIFEEKYKKKMCKKIIDIIKAE